VALTGASVLIGLGDVASCTSDGDEFTAALVDSVAEGGQRRQGGRCRVHPGDNATRRLRPGLRLCFTPSWGDTAKRIMRHIHPSPGNHEHSIFGAAPYYEYFGKSAGEPRKGYYSYNFGDWHCDRAQQRDRGEFGLHAGGAPGTRPTGSTTT
jgi:hypothetical protein